MGIFLLILKIIGITLLSIIGLIFAVLLLILFVPIRYNITVSNQQGDGKLYLRARATWLLHFINCLVSYYEELYYRVRIIIFKIVSSDKQEKKKRNKKHRSNNKEDKAAYDEDSDDTDIIKESKAEAFDDTAKIADNPDKTNNNIEDKSDGIGYGKNNKPEDIGGSIEDSIHDDTESEEPEEKQKLFDKIKAVLEKIFDVIFNIPDKITSVINKINDIRDNIDYYINAINDKRNKEAFSKCLEELIKILKSIRPRKLTGNILIGREDPYSYGQMSGILGIAYPFIHDKIKIETTNDEDITSYYIYTKGRVTVFVLLVAFIRIYFNRDIKRMIRILKHEGR